MKINKHIYVDISEKEVETKCTYYSDPRYQYQTILAYKVNFITEYDIILFGKTFHKTRTKEIPFLFRTLDMAKEFCEINPKYEEVYFRSDDSQFDYSVKFYTYQLLVNRKIIGYIWWNGKTVYFDNSYNNSMLFKYNNNSIVEGFVKNIEVKKWIETHSLSDIKYYGFTNKLADLVKPIINDNNEKQQKHWRFELIENK